MSTILVTGGAGFLGSHLCEKLIERGNNVICVDNFFSGRKANIAHLVGHPQFELIRHDIVHPLFVECDRIFNLAIAAAVLLFVGGIVFLVQGSAWVESVAQLSALMASAGSHAADAAAPSLTTYVAATGLFVSGLAMWWWAES